MPLAASGWPRVKSYEELVDWVGVEYLKMQNH